MRITLISFFVYLFAINFPSGKFAPDARIAEGSKETPSVAKAAPTSHQVDLFRNLLFIEFLNSI